MVEPVRATRRDLRVTARPPRHTGAVLTLTDPNRRTVMCGLLVGLAAPGALAACSSESKEPASSAPKGDTPGGTALAKLSAVPVGGGVIVDGPNGKVLLTRPSENEVVG